MSRRGHCLPVLLFDHLHADTRQATLNKIMSVVETAKRRLYVRSDEARRQMRRRALVSGFAFIEDSFLEGMIAFDVCTEIARSNERLRSSGASVLLRCANGWGPDAVRYEDAKMP